MGLVAKVVSRELPYTTVGETVDFTVSGMGTPDCAIFYVSGAATAANPNNLNQFGIGFWRDSDDAQNSSGCSDTNGATTTASGRSGHGARAIYLPTAAATPVMQVGYTASGITDGVRLTLSEDNTGVSRYCHAVLFWGAENVYVGDFSVASGGTQDITAPGFKPSLVLFHTSGAAGASGAVIDNAVMGHGWAHNSSSDVVTQACMLFSSLDNASSSKVNTAVRDDSCIARSLADDTSITNRASASNFDSSGFSLTNTSATGSGFSGYYLAIGLADPDSVAVGIHTDSTSAGSVSNTSLPWKPAFLGVGMMRETTLNTTNTAPVTGFTVGLADGTTNCSMGICSVDSTGTTDTESWQNSANLYLRDHQGSNDATCTVSSFNSDGWTFSWDAAKNGTYKFPFWAVKEDTGASISPNLLTNSSTVYQPAVTFGAVSVAPSLLTNTSTLYQPAVSAGAVTVSPDLLTSTSSLFAPALSFGAVSVSPNLLTNTSSLHQPLVSAGGVVILADVLTDTSTVYDPAVSFGATSVAPDLLTNSSTVFQPAVTTSFTILADLVENTSTLFDPAVSMGTLAISPDLLGNTSIIYPPAVQVASSFTQAQLDEILAYVEANMAVPTVEQIAAAVWTHALESTLTAEQIQRILLAGMSGNRTGIPETYAPGTEIKYWSVDGTKPRITYTPTDANSNGTSVLDGS